MPKSNIAKAITKEVSKSRKVPKEAKPAKEPKWNLTGTDWSTKTGGFK